MCKDYLMLVIIYTNVFLDLILAENWRKGEKASGRERETDRDRDAEDKLIRLKHISMAVSIRRFAQFI